MLTETPGDLEFINDIVKKRKNPFLHLIVSVSNVLSLPLVFKHVLASRQVRRYDALYKIGDTATSGCIISLQVIRGWLGTSSEQNAAKRDEVTPITSAILLTIDRNCYLFRWSLIIRFTSAIGVQ